MRGRGLRRRSGNRERGNLEDYVADRGRRLKAPGGVAFYDE